MNTFMLKFLHILLNLNFALIIYSAEKRSFHLNEKRKILNQMKKLQVQLQSDSIELRNGK